MHKTSPAQKKTVKNKPNSSQKPTGVQQKSRVNPSKPQSSAAKSNARKRPTTQPSKGKSGANGKGRKGSGRR